MGRGQLLRLGHQLRGLNDKAEGSVLEQVNKLVRERGDRETQPLWHQYSNDGLPSAHTQGIGSLYLLIRYGFEAALHVLDLISGTVENKSNKGSCVRGNSYPKGQQEFRQTVVYHVQLDQQGSTPHQLHIHGYDSIQKAPAVHPH